MAKKLPMIFKKIKIIFLLILLSGCDTQITKQECQHQYFPDYNTGQRECPENNNWFDYR